MRHDCPTMTVQGWERCRPNFNFFYNSSNLWEVLDAFDFALVSRTDSFLCDTQVFPLKMPAIRHASKRKPPPEGFSDIENDLLIFSNKMKDAQNKPAPSGPRHQAQWEVFQIAHQRSRYVYDLYYEKEAISKQLYDWLLKNGYADAMLIAKWKKQGYEKVCLLPSGYA